MKRRQFIAGFGSAAAWPFVVRAQQRTKPTIGWLDVRPGGPLPEFVEGFRRGLAELNFSEGRDVTVEYHNADGYPERLPALAVDLVRRRPTAIIAITGPAALAAKAAARDIPIIFAAATDAVELGLVASLNRPGGNLTGLVSLASEIAEKRLELLHKAVPTAETIALLVGPADTPLNRNRGRGYAISGPYSWVTLAGLQRNSRHRDDASLYHACRAPGRRHFGGRFRGICYETRSNPVACGSPCTTDHVFYSSDVRAGGLLSYSPDYIEISRPLGAYTVRILKGEKPGDLPVVQPTKFEFVINLKTAKALGLETPNSVVAVADEVIE